MTPKPNPVLFIHGLWIHTTSWEAWEELFQQAGYQTLAPGWPGEPASAEDARANPDSVAGLGIDDVVEHYAGVIRDLDVPPILVGHSFGGMIAEKLLGQDRAAACVAIDAAQIKGVYALPVRAALATLPVFKNPRNKSRSVMLTEDEFRYAFGNAVSEDESNALYARWAVPSPGRPLSEAASANFSFALPG